MPGDHPDLDFDFSLLGELICQEGCEVAAVRRLMAAMLELPDEEFKEKVLPGVRAAWSLAGRPSWAILDALEDRLCEITGKELPATLAYLRGERLKRREQGKI